MKFIYAAGAIGVAVIMAITPLQKGYGPYSWWGRHHTSVTLLKLVSGMIAFCAYLFWRFWDGKRFR